MQDALNALNTVNMNNINSAKLLGEEIGYTNEEFFKFAKQADLSGDVTAQYAEHMKKAGKATSAFSATLKSVAANMAIMTAISLAIKGITWAWNELDLSGKRCKESIDELASSFKSAFDTANSNAKTVEGLASKYEELSKGVNSLGDNVSLTADEYKEYQLITSQIAEMFPEFIAGYTAEGDAILSLKGNVEELREAYKEAQLAAYSLLVAGDGEKVLKNFDKVVNGTGFNGVVLDVSTDTKLKQYDELEKAILKQIQLNKSLAESMKEGSSSDLYSWIHGDTDGFRNNPRLKDAGIDFTELKDASEKELAAILKNIQVEKKNIQSEIDSAIQNVELKANAYLNLDPIYQDLDRGSQNFASMLVNNMDRALVESFEGNETKIASYVAEVLELVASDDPEVKKALVGLFTTNYEDLPLEESTKAINEYVATLAELLKRNPLELKMALKLDNVDTLYNNLAEINNKAAEKFSGSSAKNRNNEKYINDRKELDNFVKENAINTQEEEAFWNQCLEESKTKEDAMNKYLTGDINLDKTTISLSVSDTINQLNTQLKPTFDALKKSYQEIFTADGFTMENVDLDMLNNVISVMEKMKEEGLSVDTSAFENLAKVLTDTSSTAEQVQQAFNNVATAAIDSLNPSLQQCSGENYLLIQSMLESIGIMNSEEVMVSTLGYSYEEYISAKEEAANAGLDLANSTESEIDAFVKEQIESGNCGQALVLLQLKKLLVNRTTVNTAADVQQIMNLASAAGMGAEVLVELANAKSILSSVENGEALSLVSYEHAQRAVNSIKQSMSDWKPVEVKFDGNAAAKSAGSAGKAAADAYLDAFEKELANLKSLRDRGKITEKQYLDHLRKLYEVYFKDKKKYLDQYQKYEAEYLSGMKSLHESAISGVISILDKQIAANNKQKDAALDSLNEQKDAAEEAYKAQQKLLDEQIKAIQKQIDIKQKEIDAINDAAEARKKEMDIQRLQHDLERAKNQRDKYVYKDGGGSYEIDSSAVTDARQKLDDAVREKNISKIEKEMSLLEDKIDVLEEQKSAIDAMIESSNAYYDSLIKQSENYWDSIINGLEDYKSRWEELAELEEQAKMVSVLEQLGMSTEDILGMSESAFQDFKNNYLNILADMYSGNDQMTKSLSELANVDMGSLNGYLKETQGHIDELRDIDFKNVTDSIATMSDRFGDVSESVSDAASAISGSGGGGSKSSGGTGGSGGKSESSDGQSSSSLKSAVEEQVTGATEQLTKEADLFKGEDGIKGAVQEVVEKIGGGDDENEDSDTLTSAIQNQVDIASELLPQEQELFQALSDVMGQAQDHLSEIKTMLEDMDGKEFTVTLNVNGGGVGGMSFSTTGFPSLPGHASGVKKIGKDETAWTQEAGREIIISPSTGSVLTPLSQGDSVLKNAFTENIFEWAKISPFKFAESFSPNNLPENKPQTVHVEQNINVTAPYLTNDGGYNRFVNEMQGLATQAYQYAMKR